jgi:hypothetical protein
MGATCYPGKKVGRREWRTLVSDLQIDPFRDAYQRDDLSSSQLANAIEDAFGEYALEIIKTGVDEISLNRKVLLRFKDIWKTIYSNRRCLSCFARTLEDTL